MVAPPSWRPERLRHAIGGEPGTDFAAGPGPMLGRIAVGRHAQLLERRGGWLGCFRQVQGSERDIERPEHPEPRGGQRSLDRVAPENELFDPGSPQADMDEVGTRVMERFARLQRRYGRWGLAYLESLVRAADYAASAAPSRTEANTR